MFRSGDGSEEEGMEGSRLFHSHLLTGTQLRGEGAGTSVGALAAHARGTGLWVTGPGTARGLLWGSAVAPSPMEGVGQGHPSRWSLILLIKAATSSASGFWEPPRTGTTPPPVLGDAGPAPAPLLSFPAKHSRERQRQGFLGHLLAISSFHYSWRRQMGRGNGARARGTGSWCVPA